MTAKRLLSYTHHSVYLCSLAALMPACGQEEDSSGLYSSTESASPAPAATPSKHDWRRTMSKTALPKPGCFKATHPGSTWQEIPCQSPPNMAHSPAPNHAKSTSGTLASPSISPATVGYGTDFAAVTPQHITWAEGSFPRVTGVTGTDPYSLQLNASREFTTGQGLCANAQTPSDCSRWQQFMFATPWIFSQYWLVDYANVCTNTYKQPCPQGCASCYACPQGWTADNSTTHGCFRNGNGYFVNEIENMPLSDLANLTLIGHATSTGDQVFLETGNGTLYTAGDAGELLNLSQWWNQAEFNVFGWSNGNTVNLGSNAVVTVQLITDTTPASSPTVVSGGFTGETNNLTLVPGSQCAFGGSQPGIQFTEGYVGATSPGCPLPIQEDPVAFQANTSFLYLYNNGQPTNTWLGMYPGTIPSLVMSPTGALPKIAFQANTGHLFLHDMNTWPPVDTGLRMKLGTSPSITLIANKYPADKVIVAYQTLGGKLALYRSDTGTAQTTAGDMTGSPSIAWDPSQTNYGNFVVAFRSAADNKCYVYSGSSGGFSKCNSGEPTMAAGTNPSIAALPNNTYTTMFQGSDGYLYLYYPGSYKPGGGGNTGLRMMAGTSPSVTVIHDGTIAAAYQDYTGYLVTFVEGALNFTYNQGFPQMAQRASPIVLPTSKFGYQVSFEANDTFLYLDDNGTAVNTWQGMNTP